MGDRKKWRVRNKEIRREIGREKEREETEINEVGESRLRNRERERKKVEERDGD